MAEQTKNLCAQIPLALHTRVREEQEKAGLPLSAYITRLLTEYYENDGNGNTKMDNKMDDGIPDPGGAVPAAEAPPGPGIRADWEGCFYLCLLHNRILPFNISLALAAQLYRIKRK